MIKTRSSITHVRCLKNNRKHGNSGNIWSIYKAGGALYFFSADGRGEGEDGMRAFYITSHNVYFTSIYHGDARYAPNQPPTGHHIFCSISRRNVTMDENQCIAVLMIWYASTPVAPFISSFASRMKSL